MATLSISNELQFLREFLARPLRIASPVPSGRKLAGKIAEQIDPQPGGVVLELGSGTGAVTCAIRERGIADSDLVAIESEPRFAALLHAQLPQVRIVEGDAFEFMNWPGVGNVRSGVEARQHPQSSWGHVLASEYWVGHRDQANRCMPSVERLRCRLG